MGCNIFGSGFNLVISGFGFELVHFWQGFKSLKFQPALEDCQLLFTSRVLTNKMCLSVLVDILVSLCSCQVLDTIDR